MGAVALTCTLLFAVIHVLRHPTADVWLSCVNGAFSSASLGALLLFFAKTPQYRAGVFWRVGCGHLPRRFRQLYWSAFLLIVPSCLFLIALLLIAPRIS